MNRIIKFRAWDDRDKKMFRVKELHFDTPVDPDGIIISPWGGVYSMGFPLMQFTGLHDKNGVEIYEGDVVMDEEGFNFSVGWNEDGFWELTARNDTGELEPQQEPMCYMAATEVIGNIYENPELLTP